MKHICFLSIGSNLGDRLLNIHAVISRLSSSFHIVDTSSFYHAESWGYKDDDYINCVLKMETTLSPFVLLQELINIEKQMGRIEKTTTQYQARRIDLDILFYDNQIIDLDILKVPHPKLYYRNFVLVPFNQIAPNFQCPVTKKNISQLLSECSDESKISIYTH